MNVFLDEEDCNFFLLRLKECLFPELVNQGGLSWSEKRRKILPTNSFRLICYCVMPNHFHLLIEQVGVLPISKLILKVCTSYSIYFNKKYKRVGSIFQDTFKSVRIEKNEQLLWTSIYIHNNPVKAELVKNPADYRWCSFNELVGSTKNCICKAKIITSQYNSLSAYSSFFYVPKSQARAEEIMIGYQDLFIDH